MPTRTQFRFTLMMLAGWTASLALLRLWAARHSTHDGPDGVIADAVNTAV